MKKDTQRIASLVEEYGERAWRVAMAYLRDEHAAYDAVQQAFLVVTRKADQIPRRNPWPWLSVVVANEARNMRRKKRPIPIEDQTLNAKAGASNAPSPSEVLLREETQAALEGALDALPEDERDAVSLTCLGGMTHQAAAEVLGVPRKTLSSRVHRGLERMRKKLQKSDPEIRSLLAAAPIALPSAGMAAAIQSWKASALQLASTISTTTAAAGAGAILMTKLSVASIAIALVVGLGGGMLIAPSFGDPARDEPDEAKREQSANSKASKASKKKEAKHSGKSATSDSQPEAHSGQDAETIAALRRALSQEQEGRKAALQEYKALLEEVRPLRKAKAEAMPIFTFGHGGKLDAVKIQNWKEFGEAGKLVNEAMLKLFEHRQAGTKAPSELYLQMQRYTERMRQYEYDSWSKLDSAAAQNRETTHPITITNMMAAQLREAGVPLSSSQVSSIETLGEDWERDFQAKRASYSGDVPNVRKMADELKMKGDFGDALIATLTSEQKKVVVNPDTWRTARLDLYCPTLMVIHSTAILSGDDMKTIEAKLIETLSKGTKNRAYSWSGLKLSAEQIKALKPHLELFFHSCAETLKASDPGLLANYSYAQAVEFAEASAQFYSTILQVISPTDEQRDALLGSKLLFAPRLIKKQSD